MNIALCGMMGCGKTTVAKILSENYSLPLIDTDAKIVESYGKISDIFDEKGEQYFREIESRIIAKYCTQDKNFVIALGGGAVLNDINVLNLKKSGKIVYLRTKAETLAERLKNSTDRPLLRGTMRDIIDEILSKRAPIYERAADLCVDTDNLSPEKIACIIAEELL